MKLLLAIAPLMIVPLTALASDGNRLRGRQEERDLQQAEDATASLEDVGAGFASVKEEAARGGGGTVGSSEQDDGQELGKDESNVAVRGGLALSAAGGGEIYAALLNPAQLNSPCTASSALGNAVATFNPTNRELCSYISYTELSSPETGTSIGNPKTESIRKLNSGHIKSHECRRLSVKDGSYLKAGQLYFLIKSELCPMGEIKGQLYPIGTQAPPPEQ